MTTENQAILEKAAITTGALANGLLNPEQAKKFIQQTFEATNLAPLVRHEIRTAKSGEIDKIGIASRIVRKKTENVDDGYRADVETSKLEYATTAIRLPWEITEETLRENIEGQNFEAIVTDLMTKQLGVDMEDLYLNGDTSTASSDPDYDFLKINDGWIKQIAANGHVLDASASPYSGAMSIGLFYDAVKAMPNKYNNGKLKWLMSPKRAQEWEKYLLNQVITNGGAVPDSLYNSPAGIGHIACPSLPDSKIVLTDPQNLVVVNTYSVQIRKTTEGKEAIMQDKRFYVVHLDYDPIIEETDATTIITGLSSI
ncbi:MAG: P2 family phage major capsid protein [Spirochaetales bacterium]|nr:P2 family phage major capsid protein [Spirochaetales bacterium]